MRAAVDRWCKEEGKGMASRLSGVGQLTENPSGNRGEAQEAGLCVS